jgi:crotonobetaine/carnitine-CoA ligase
MVMTQGNLPGPFHIFAGQDLPHLLEAWARDRGQHPFLIYAPPDAPAQEWTYRAFRDAVAKFAGGLASHGVTRGHFVIIHMDNSIEFLLAWHACSRLGAIAVTTNTRSSLDELAYFIAHCGARFAITEPIHTALVQAAGPALQWLCVTSSDGGIEPSTPRPSDVIAFESLLAGDHDEAPLRRAEPLLANSVQYTSGSTARPKAVVWTHANALWGARIGALTCQVQPHDIGHSCLPLYHTNALSYSHLATLWAGATLVFQRRFSASRYWPCVVQHGCTWGVQIPFMLKALLAQPVPAHAITRWGLGGMDPPVVMEKFGIPCIGWFGMTETVSLPLCSTWNLPGTIGSMGSVVPGYEIDVRRDDGASVAIGETGILWIKGVRGISLFQEYLNNPEATREAFDDRGWFKTGDRVIPHADGSITFDGRARDMLRVGDENVAESEIEHVLLGTGLVAEVAVVAKPHRMLDEVPVAFVTPVTDTKDLVPALLAACRAKLAKFKVPDEIIVVTDLPRLIIGKIDKQTLRRQMAERHRETS